MPFQGLPARICWLGYGERAQAGLAFNELVRTGEVSAPIVIGRDHLDAGSVASPNRETEAMADGSDAVADWPLLNALVNTAAGASWVSIHHGGGVGIGYSQHAGMVVVADGTPLAAQKLERVLTTDPAMGVLRHVDAGYERAIEVARERGVHVPMLAELTPRHRCRRPRRRHRRVASIRVCWSNPSRTSPRVAGSTSSTGSPRRSSRCPASSLLDRTSDASHNRSVFTIAGEHDAVADALERLVGAAIHEIDMDAHEGEHPRIGAVDVIPFIPLGVDDDGRLRSTSPARSVSASRPLRPAGLPLRPRRARDRIARSSPTSGAASTRG